MDDEPKQNSRSKFVEEFLDENPQKLIFTEVGAVLQDFINAYKVMKQEGDMPSLHGITLKNFQNCLLIVFAERNLLNIKTIN